MNLSNVLKFVDLTLHQKCRYLELFWSLFSRIWTEYGEIRLRIHSECGKIQTRVTPKVLQSSQENTCATNFLFLKKSCRWLWWLLLALTFISKLGRRLRVPHQATSYFVTILLSLLISSFQFMETASFYQKSVISEIRNLHNLT